MIMTGGDDQLDLGPAQPRTATAAAQEWSSPWIQHTGPHSDSPSTIILYPSNEICTLYIPATF